MYFIQGFIAAWIWKCIGLIYHNPCEFSKEYYVADGCYRAKEVHAWVCPGLIMPLVVSTCIMYTTSLTYKIIVIFGGSLTMLE